MKLGDLRGAIRKTKGNPIINLPGLTVEVLKTPLLEELEQRFPGGKAAETPFTFDAETRVLWMPISADKGQPGDGAPTEVSPDMLGGAEELLGLGADDDGLLV